MSHKLSDIAYARSGDKGAGANIGVIARSPEAYSFLQRYLTPARVEQYFAHLGPGRVARYELPNLLALNFVLPAILDGGGSLSLRVDAQGKALGQALLEMPIESTLADFDPPAKNAGADEPLATLEYHEASIAILTLNRPAKRNALNLALIEKLTELVSQLSPRARVLVLRGAGPAFCAGLDLKESAAGGDVHATAEALAKLYGAIGNCPVITIAAAHGPAMGGGAGLVAACDLALAADDLQLAYPEVKRGLVAALVTCLLRRQVNDRIVRELILLGQATAAPRALALGLVNEVVPRDQLFPRAMEVARSACAGAPGAIARSKKLLDALAARSLDEDLRIALQFHLSARNAAEAAEGLAAFLEKRQPNWTGS